MVNKFNALILLALCAAPAAAQTKNYAVPTYQLTGEDYRQESPALNQMFRNTQLETQYLQGQITPLAATVVTISSAVTNSGSTIAVVSPLSGVGTQANPVALTGAIHPVNINLSTVAAIGSCSLPNVVTAVNANAVPTCTEPSNTTGSAALDVLKTGDTMTGQLTISGSSLTVSYGVKAGSFTGVGQGLSFTRPTVIAYEQFPVNGGNAIVIGPWGETVLSSTMPTQTAGLQEAVNYATSNGYDLYIMGGLFNSTGRGVYTLNQTLNIPPSYHFHVATGGIQVTCAATVSTSPCVNIDSYDLMTWDWRGAEIIMESSGPVVRIQPAGMIPVDNSSGAVAANELDFGSLVYANTSSGTACIEINPLSIVTGNHLSMAECNINNSPYVKHAFLVDDASVSTDIVKNNDFSLGWMHGGFVGPMVQLGSTTVSTSGNRISGLWDLYPKDLAIYSYGIGDVFYPEFRVNDPSFNSPGNALVTWAPGTSANAIYTSSIPAVSGTPVVVDSGTNNFLMGGATYYGSFNVTRRITASYDVRASSIDIPNSIITSTTAIFNIGNVGIGIATPANALDVNGGIALGANAGTAGPTNGLSMSGKLGVGMQLPSYNIDSIGDVRDQGQLIVTGSATITGAAGLGVTYEISAGTVVVSGSVITSTIAIFGTNAVIGASGLLASGSNGTIEAQNNSNGARTTALNLINNNGAPGTSVSEDFTPNTNIALARINANRTDAAGGGTTDFAFSLYNGSSLTEYFRLVGAGGHIETSGTSPTVSTCGTSPSIVGNDNNGTVTVGTGVTTACTLTFSKPWTNAPDCTLSDNSTAVTGDISAVSTTAITFSFSASLGGGQIYYHCGGHR